MSREITQQIVVALKALMTGYVGDAEDAIYVIEKELAKPEQVPTLFFGRAVYFADPRTGEILPPSDLSIEANRVAYDVAMHYANKTKEKLAVPEAINHAAKHWHDVYRAKCKDFHDAQARLGAEIVALEEELAELKEEQIEQEPVAYADALDLAKDCNWDTFICKHSSENHEGTRFKIPLYTAPPRKEWVGLTDADLMKEFGYTDELLRDTAYRVAKILEGRNT